MIVLLPGPPRELQPMLNALCEGVLARRAGGERIYRASLFVTGRTRVARRGGGPADLLDMADATPADRDHDPRDARPDRAAPVAAVGRRSAPQQAVCATRQARWSARSGRRRVQHRRPDAWRRSSATCCASGGSTIAAAESCTGGLLLSRLTDVAGQLRLRRRAASCLQQRAEDRRSADVPADLIEAHGAVSEPVAVAMAEGIRARTGADVGVGITGIAGPGGGTPAKPVGTSRLPCSCPDGPARVRTFSLSRRAHAGQVPRDAGARSTWCAGCWLTGGLAPVRLFIGVELDDPSPRRPRTSPSASR